MSYDHVSHNSPAVLSKRSLSVALKSYHGQLISNGKSVIKTIMGQFFFRSVQLNYQTPIQGPQEMTLKLFYPVLYPDSPFKCMLSQQLWQQLLPSPHFIIQCHTIQANTQSGMNQNIAVTPAYVTMWSHAGSCYMGSLF